MMEYQKLAFLNRDFRDYTSNLMNSNYENASVNLIRFMNFVEENAIIHDIVHDVVDTTEFDFKECFIMDAGSLQVKIPINEKQQIKAIYDYMWYIIKDKKGNVAFQALNYPCSSSKWVDILHHFFSNIVGPFSDYIKHELEKRLIVLKGDTQPVITMNQNIENVNGNVVQQQSGNITINTNNNGVSGEDLNGLIEKIISSLSEIKDVDTEEVDSVKDDLESLQEQIQSPTPKKNRMQKALNGVQKFFSDFGMKVAVTVAAKVVTSQDWTALIQQAQLFIGNL